MVFARIKARFVVPLNHGPIVSPFLSPVHHPFSFPFPLPSSPLKRNSRAVMQPVRGPLSSGFSRMSEIWAVSVCPPPHG